MPIGRILIRVVRNFAVQYLGKAWDRTFVIISICSASTRSFRSALMLSYAAEPRMACPEYLLT